MLNVASGNFIWVHLLHLQTNYLWLLRFKTKTNSGKVILCVTESHLFTTWNYRHFMAMSWKTQWVSLTTSRPSASRYGFGWVKQQQTLIQETMVCFPLETLWALGSDGECLSPFVFNTPLKLAKYLCLMILMGKLAYMVLKHWKWSRGPDREEL